MTTEPLMLTDRAAELRHSFDLAFTQAAISRDTALQSYLAIRVGGDPFAIRLSDLSHLVADKACTPVPVSAPGLLGITALRSSIVVVYDLRVLLGYVANGTPRWILLTAADPTLGLAFDEFEGQRRVSQDAISYDTGSNSNHNNVMHDGDVMRPVIHIDGLIEQLRKN